MFSRSLVIMGLGMAMALGVRGDTIRPNTGDQTLGFIFGFSTSSLILPITPSCPDPLPITPLTPLDSSGAGDTVGPFTLLFLVREQLMTPNGSLRAVNYAHREEFEEMKDLQSLSIPFMNGTQFIACAWSSNLVSGGCQDLFTVVPSLAYDSAYATSDSTCRRNETLGSWIPAPEDRLDVVLEGPNGAVSEVGWPACCTDLMFTPKNGTPPYTTMISPTQHPPVNISSSSTTSMEPSDHKMNYTIRYTHGQAFMVSVHDSVGRSWAAGPLHAGQSLTDVKCLGVRTGEMATVDEGKGGWTKGKAIGGIVGGTIGALVLGLLLGWLAGAMIAKRRKKANNMNPYSSNARPVDGSSESFKNKHVTPYDILAPNTASLDTPGAGTSTAPRPGAPNNQNVYVVHADSGGDDLHIQLPNPAARVIEMPPEYQNRPRSGSSTALSGTSGTPTGGGGGGGGGMGGKSRPRMGLRVSSSAEPDVTTPTSPSGQTQMSEKSGR